MTRFFAGCFSKGELPALADSLEMLTAESGYQDISYPRLLAAMLLSDWVFTQQPNSLQRVLSLILNEKSVRLLFGASNRQFDVEALNLPERCGRQEVVKYCFDQLKKQKHPDFERILCEILSDNSSSEYLGQRWLDLVASQNAEFWPRWFYLSNEMKVLGEINCAALETLLSNLENEEPIISQLLFAGRFGAIAESW